MQFVKSFLISLMALTMVAMPTVAVSSYFNGFEVDTAGWNDFAGGVITRVPSGTNAIASKTGDWHAETTGAVFTRWGGYESAFPTNGYVTEVAVYLDMSLADGTDKRFDFSSAINRPDGTHRRDFIFHLGTNPSVPGQWAASASNNAPGWPLNPDRAPVHITQSGWYVLRHTFSDDGTGVLQVTLDLLDSADATIGTWVLSDASDVIGSTVGGNRYGWFTSQRFDFARISLDDSRKFNIRLNPADKDACQEGEWQKYEFRNQGQCIRFVNTGQDSRTE